MTPISYCAGRNPRHHLGQLYQERKTDHELQQQLDDGQKIICIHNPVSTGKTSLLQYHAMKNMESGQAISVYHNLFCSAARFHDLLPLLMNGFMEYLRIDCRSSKRWRMFYQQNNHDAKAMIGEFTAIVKKYMGDKKIILFIDNMEELYRIQDYQYEQSWLNKFALGKKYLTVKQLNDRAKVESLFFDFIANCNPIQCVLAGANCQWSEHLIANEGAVQLNIEPFKKSEIKPLLMPLKSICSNLSKLADDVFQLTGGNSRLVQVVLAQIWSDCIKTEMTFSESYLKTMIDDICSEEITSHLNFIERILYCYESRDFEPHQRVLFSLKPLDFAISIGLVDYWGKFTNDIYRKRYGNQCTMDLKRNYRAFFLTHFE